MVVALAQVIGGLSAPYVIGAILLPVLFVGWVIISERRTRHLARLIHAVRRPAHPGGNPRARRRGNS